MARAGFNAPGMTLNFGVRDLSGLAANFRGVDARLRRDVRRTVARNAGRMLELVHAYVAFDTGRMLRLAKILMTPSGLAFEIGWLAADFYAEGEEFYPPFVEIGTYRQAAQPSVLPAYLEVKGRLSDEIARDMRRAAVRAGV